MKRLILAALISCGLFSAAEAKQRQYAVHPECNVTMPCEGVTTSARGERVRKAMGGLGTATKVYKPRHAALHPARVRVEQPAHRLRIEPQVQRVVGLGPIPDHKEIGPRPGRWCGWFMQHETGVTSAGTGLNLNRAIEWRRVGQATQAGVGAIVVWAHHVGKIVGGEPGRWIVRSGNDGNRVRERVVSLRGVVAFRQL